MIDAERIRESLRASLPYYMVPQHCIELEALPQTNNGKIDYKALPVPNANTEVASDEFQPQTAVQRLIAEIWQDTLDIDDVMISDNFFDLGGHSLLVMKVINAIEERTGARLNPPEFLIGTLEQLADKVEEEADVLPSEFDSAASDDAAVQNPQGQQQAQVQPVIEEIAAEIEVDTRSIFQKLKGFWD